MRRSVLVGLAALAAVTAVVAPSGAAAQVPSDEQRFVPSVVSAFDGLSLRPDALAFARGTSPEATLCKHYQGMARKDGPDGTPYVFLTRSGNQFNSSICSGSDEPGHLVVVKLGSRDPSGERLGTNLHPFAGGFSDRPNLDGDRVVKTIPFDGDHGVPAYRHPGGMQIVGDVLAMGVEHPFKGGVRATIFFFDVSTPEQPRYLDRFDPPDLDGSENAGFGADPIGLTPVKNADGTCCRYLMMVAGSGNRQVRFFRSLPDPGKTTTDLMARLESGAPAWEEVGRFNEGAIEECVGAGNWPTAGTAQSQYQLLNFVREGSMDGQLYLVAGRRDGIAEPFDTDPEIMALYEVELTNNGAPTTCWLEHVRSRVVGAEAWGEGQVVGSFAAGSSAYVSPTGELLVYVSNHDACCGGDYVVFSEFRPHGLVRPDSPTLRPTASVTGPFAVDEGSSVGLTGQGEAPITKAFIQLYDRAGAGVQDANGAGLVVEYGNRTADHFDDLALMRVRGESSQGIWDTASSWRWFAPPGCTIQANDFRASSNSFPGDDTVMLRGTGRFEEVNNLAGLRVHRPAGSAWPVSPPPDGDPGVLVNLSNEVEGVTFYEAYRTDAGFVRDHGCESYYNAQFTLAWDLDRNGTFETSGSPATFDAAALDGPASATVSARAAHPTDTSPVGTGDPVSVPVAVRNVAPSFGAASVTDALGRALGSGGHAAIAGLPVKLAVSFSDPGRADTQTAVVDWGDASALDSAFGSFSDARNGATGVLRDAHVFSAPGSYRITTTVTDDDGGSSVREFTIEVLSLEDALEDAAATLTQLIAQAPNASVASALRAARDELIGNHEGAPPTNGALDKLEAGDPVGAITKLRAAVSYLITAESRGADSLATLKDGLGLIADGIATAAYAEAQARVAPVSAGEARALAAIAELIARGEQQLATAQHLKAFDTFRQATSKALAL